MYEIKNPKFMSVRSCFCNSTENKLDNLPIYLTEEIYKDMIKKSQGICISCKKPDYGTHGIESHWRNNKCTHCKKYSVYGLELAVKYKIVLIN